MRRVLGATVLVAAMATTAGVAQARIAYQKGNATYVARNSGKGSKLLVPNGRQPGLMPNGQTVIYSDAGNALFAIPAAGGTPVRLNTACLPATCQVYPAPDSTSLLFTDANGVLDLVPVNGGPSVRLATDVASFGSFSPDSKQVVFDKNNPDPGSLFTVPAAGGAPTAFGTDLGIAPVWTRGGIVVTDVLTGQTDVLVRLVVLDGAGNTKRVLHRATIKGDSSSGIQIPFQAVGSDVVTLELQKAGRMVLRLIGTRSGKVKAKRTIKKSVPQAISGNGKTILVTRKKGKLQAVNFKTGKRKTLIAKGVKSASMN